MNELGISYVRTKDSFVDQWKQTVISSVGHAVNMKESYQNICILLQNIKYEDHK